MPIYQYQCTECSHQLEALQKMSDPKLVECPECSEHALKKQVTAAAFKLKGTGWYETDFKNSGKKPASADTAKGTASDADSSKKSEAPAKKSSAQGDTSNQSKPAAKSA